MRILIALTLLIWTICAATAQATPTLNIYYVRSKDSIPTQYLTHINSEIKRGFKENFKTKIKIRIKGVENSNLNYSYGSTFKHFNYWHNRISKRSTRRHWALVLIPPVYKAGVRYMIGAGQSECFNSRKRVTLAIMVAENLNSFGQDRIKQTVYGALHELGHTLGLKHTVEIPATIMHSGVLYYADHNMQFSSFHKTLGRDCLRS